MSRYTRRQAMLGIAGAPIWLGRLRNLVLTEHHSDAKAQHPTNARPGAQFQQLNVIIHGLMTMEISATTPDQGVTLTFPEVDGDKPHFYLAGSLDRSKQVPSDSLFQLNPNTGYSLSGVNHGLFKPVFNRADGNIILDNSSSSYSVNRSNKRTFILPWPGSCKSVRRICRGDSLNFLDTAPAGDPNANIKEIATIHVFSYSLKNGGPIVTDSNGTTISWTPLGSVLNPPGYANLHIFAEPKVGVDSTHAIMAFTEMMKIISKGGTSLEKQYVFADFGDPRTNLGVCESDASIPGLDPVFDFKNLPQQQSNAGGEVANCVSTILPS